MSRPRLSQRDVVKLLGSGVQADVDVTDLAYPEKAKRQRKPAQVERRFPRETLVLGLDLAARKSGWAVVEGKTIVAHGTLLLPEQPRVREHWAGLLCRRYDALLTGLTGLVEMHRPAVLAYEYPDETRPIWSGGSKGRELIVARALGTVEGFVALVARELGIEAVRVPVSAAKRQMTGAVGAAKGRVYWSVMGKFGESARNLTDDEIDAVAVADAVLEE